jgi:hypothetical protein
MDAGEEAIADPARRDAIRRRAAGIHVRAALAALAAALALYAVPPY